MGTLPRGAGSKWVQGGALCVFKCERVVVLGEINHHACQTPSTVNKICMVCLQCKLVSNALHLLGKTPKVVWGHG